MEALVSYPDPHVLKHKNVLPKYIALRYQTLESHHKSRMEVCYASNVLASVCIVLALDCILSLHETLGWLCGLINVTRASVDVGVRKWVKF